MATKGILGAGSIPTLTETLAQRTKAVEEYKPKLEESLKAKEEVAGAEQTMKAERELAQQTALQTADEGYAEQVKGLPQREQMKEVREKQAVPFVPTQDNAKSLTELFMLIGITGFAIGIGGKSKAQAAMSAMDGMVKGYQQGRADLYTKEKQRFETNMKQLKQQYDELDRELTDAMKIAQTDREAAVQKARVAFAKTGADFYKQYEEKFGLARLFDYHKQAMKDKEKAETLARDELKTAQQRAYEESVRRQQRSEKFTVVGVDKDGNTVIMAGDGTMRTLEGVTPTKLAKPEKAAKPPSDVEKGIKSNAVFLDKIDDIISSGQSLVNQGNIRGIGVVAGKVPYDVAQLYMSDDEKRFVQEFQDLSNQKLKDQSGATVTGSEFARAKGVLPLRDDDPKTVLTKLNNWKKLVSQETAVFGRAFPAEIVKYGITLEVPASKDKLVKGLIYRTPQGNFKWNGETFEEVED